MNCYCQGHDERERELKCCMQPIIKVAIIFIQHQTYHLMWKIPDVADFVTINIRSSYAMIFIDGNHKFQEISRMSQLCDGNYFKLRNLELRNNACNVSCAKFDKTCMLWDSRKMWTIRSVKRNWTKEKSPHFKFYY